MWAEAQKNFFFHTLEERLCIHTGYLARRDSAVSVLLPSTQQKCEFSLNMEHNTAEWGVYLVG